jgi:cell division septum initiation protein DivIVA
MTDDRPEAHNGPEAPNGADGTLPGLLWTQAVVEGTRQAQAALAAGTLRQLSAPVMRALARHREMAAALGETARQMDRIAGHVADLARQQESANDQLQASMEPYLRYIEWLDRESPAESPAPGERAT